MPGADDRLILDVSRQVVGDLAPGELEVFDATGDAYLEAPAGKDGEEMLGFGVEVVAFVTPFVVMATKAVVSYLSEVVSKAMKEQSESVIAGYVKRLFKRFHDDPEPAPVQLTIEEIKKAHEVALAEAKALGMKDERASLLANAIAGELVTQA
ncbi:MAG TPA: hypothetical protein VKD67_02160 [Acidimicrobiales bacterium]|nr:hypothetical protein [Acidimicrobiales bacterium]